MLDNGKHIILFHYVFREIDAGSVIGQHNEQVLKGILGLSDSDIADYIAERAITKDADLPDFGVVT